MIVLGQYDEAKEKKIQMDEFRSEMVRGFDYFKQNPTREKTTLRWF